MKHTKEQMEAGTRAVEHLSSKAMIAFAENPIVVYRYWSKDGAVRFALEYEENLYEDLTVAQLEEELEAIYDESREEPEDDEADY